MLIEAVQEKTMNRRRQLILATAMLAATPKAWSGDAAWPSRPIRIVAGGVGGVTDVRARWLAERLAPAIGQPVTVENNASAGGNVGAEQVARSAPDGYTLLVLHQGTAAINPHLFARTGYDPLTDFCAHHTLRLWPVADGCACEPALPLRGRGHRAGEKQAG
jgi:tripartite-type tricarboxylate transporter receptor subunit TctC